MSDVTSLHCAHLVLERCVHVVRTQAVYRNCNSTALAQLGVQRTLSLSDVYMLVTLLSSACSTAA